MALELIKQPQGAPDAGLFNLPPGFDTKKWAVEWVPEDQVVFKQQRQSIPDSGMSADGWVVYHPSVSDEEQSKKGRKEATKVVNGKSKTFVLMVRPRIIQDQVNALCGNISKSRIVREVKGETVAGNAQSDSGILTEQRLRETQEGGSFEGGSGDVTPNEIPSAQIET